VGALAAPPARAASLQQVSDWQAGKTFPSDVSMYVYVPDKVSANSPLVTLIHFCGGSAQAVFGQAQGGGFIAAADQYGFIVVVPSNADSSGANGRCWDVSSTEAQTRDGGGDTHAIKQMVKYALGKYQANADRVYCTGDSSGGMTTQLLLALYPDVFKAGVAFAGVPAGCANVFDGSGLCGLPAQTAQQWGDRVRAMYQGYSGHRPRVQLFHGDADNIITYKNQAEAIKEWTNVLGLSTDPTSTDDSLTLGTDPKHQATRQSWKNSCGYVVLDVFTEHKDPNKSADDPTAGGDHGPSDTLFVAKYVVPFLGLDQAGAVDPEMAKCGGTAGAGGQGGAAGGKGGSAGGGAGGPIAGHGGNAGSAGGGTGGSGGSAGGGTGGNGHIGGQSLAGASGRSGSGGAAGNCTRGGASSGCSHAGAHSRGMALLPALGLILALAARRRNRRS
jgi:poly(hydroxyalkanoate) depolymerase family esterase